MQPLQNLVETSGAVIEENPKLNETYRREVEV